MTSQESGQAPLPVGRGLELFVSQDAINSVLDCMPLAGKEIPDAQFDAWISQQSALLGEVDALRMTPVEPANQPAAGAGNAPEKNDPANSEPANSEPMSTDDTPATDAAGAAADADQAATDDAAGDASEDPLPSPVIGTPAEATESEAPEANTDGVDNAAADQTSDEQAEEAPAASIATGPSAEPSELKNGPALGLEAPATIVTQKEPIAPKIATVILADAQPVRIRFEDGRIVLSLRAKFRPVVGPDTNWKELRIPFSLTVDTDVVRLTPDAKLSVTDLETASALTTRGLDVLANEIIEHQVSARLSRRFRSRIATIPVGDNRRETLRLEAASATNGWLSLSWDWVVAKPKAAASLQQPARRAK